jgi:pimeloyl-ACP methyl ester carboxylesterase
MPSPWGSVTDAEPLQLIGGDGVTLAARRYGNPGDPTLLMVHGFPDTQELWAPLAVLLARRGHHVITYDLRGAGASGDPSGRRPYALRRLAGDARAVIDQLAGAEAAVHLVGHDWGAIQGWEFLYQPQTAPRIASFACINGACFDHTALLWRSRLATRSPRELAGIADQLRRSWYMLALGLPWLFRPVWRALLAPRWAALLSRLEGLEAQEGFPAASIARDGANLCGLYWRTPLERLLAPVRRQAVNIPVLVVRSQRDRFLAPSTLAGIERFAPSVQIATVPGGHWAPRAQPQLLCELIEAHLARYSSRA